MACIIRKDDLQICNDDKISLNGETMRHLLIGRHFGVIREGTVLVMQHSSGNVLLFETLTTIDIEKVKGITLVYPIPGTKKIFSRYEEYIPIGGISEHLADAILSMGITF